MRNGVLNSRSSLQREKCGGSHLIKLTLLVEGTLPCCKQPELLYFALSTLSQDCCQRTWWTDMDADMDKNLRWLMHPGGWAVGQQEHPPQLACDHHGQRNEESGSSPGAGFQTVYLYVSFNLWHKHKLQPLLPSPPTRWHSMSRQREAAFVPRSSRPLASAAAPSRNAPDPYGWTRVTSSGWARLGPIYIYQANNMSVAIKCEQILYIILNY